MNNLALYGGEPLIKQAMPKRKAFGEHEIAALQQAIAFYQDNDADPGYYGPFEQQYCALFSQYMGGGYTNAVATGTGAIYVALAALELTPHSHIVMSPITDPGTFNAAVLQGFCVSLADTEPNSMNTSWQQIEKVLTPQTSAIILVHATGVAADIKTIATNAKARGIRLLEDCSQSPGAHCDGQKLGTFGDIAALSTMYRKSLASGGSGGLVFTRDRALHFKSLAYGDRGKDFSSDDYQERNAEKYMFPALNWNTNELSCAIGIASLRRLDETIAQRSAFCQQFIRLMAQSSCCTVAPFVVGSSPFFLNVLFSGASAAVTKELFCQALLAEGVELNPQYRFVISQWPWATRYLTEFRDTPNALNTRDNSFNIYLNENYTGDTALQIFAAFTKVEQYFLAQPAHQSESAG